MQRVCHSPLFNRWRPLTLFSAEGFTYKCRGHGALLSLPHDGHREDAIRRRVFKDYIRDNVVSWFEWSRDNGLDVERMEDLILVSGCTLVTSWGAAVFLDHGPDEAAISLADYPLPNGGGRFAWANINRVVPHHNSQLESVCSPVFVLSSWTDFFICCTKRILHSRQ
jgi:hypothetical protein